MSDQVLLFCFWGYIFCSEYTTCSFCSMKLGHSYCFLFSSSVTLAKLLVLAFVLFAELRFVSKIRPTVFFSCTWCDRILLCLDVCGEMPWKVYDLSQSLHQQQRLWLLQDLLQRGCDEINGEFKARCFLPVFNFCQTLATHLLSVFGWSVFQGVPEILSQGLCPAMLTPSKPCEWMIQNQLFLDYMPHSVLILNPGADVYGSDI